MLADFSEIRGPLARGRSSRVGLISAVDKNCAETWNLAWTLFILRDEALWGTAAPSGAEFVRFYAQSRTFAPLCLAQLHLWLLAARSKPDPRAQPGCFHRESVTVDEGLSPCRTGVNGIRQDGVTTSDGKIGCCPTAGQKRVEKPPTRRNGQP